MEEFYTYEENGKPKLMEIFTNNEDNEPLLKDFFENTKKAAIKMPPIIHTASILTLLVFKHLNI